MKKSKKLYASWLLSLSLSMMATASLANQMTVANADDVSGQELDLTVLDSQHNPLSGIDGLHQGRVPLNSISPDTLKTFVSVVDLVRREYPQQVSDDDLFYHAINGMLTKVDAHAEFLDWQAYANLKSFTDGGIANVGLVVSWQADENHWVVSEVVNDSSAAQAGVSVGDYVHQVGEIRLTAEHTPNDVAQLLSGIEGSNVDVTFSKSGRSKRTKTLERSQAMKSSVETAVKDGVVVIKLPVFQSTTREQLLQGLSYVGVPVQGIILDVRNNPGGVLESAVDVVSLFMRNQPVVQIKSRQGGERLLKTSGSPLLDEIPVMVLQNRYSASAAEVLASALQTQKRALVVGEKSYGKGSVQSIIPVGDNQAIKLTTAYYLTADGDAIDNVGVSADVELDSRDGVDVLNQALALMEKAKLEKGIAFAPVGGF